MTYLIDGYNLLHFMGLLSGPTGPDGLEKARRGLTGLLRHSFDGRTTEVVVVFDAHNAPGGLPRETYDGTVAVRFAAGYDEADDLIEEFVLEHSVPKQLTVVSDDHRLQIAAKRRHASAMACEEFMELVENKRRKQQRLTSAEKPKQLSDEETEQLLEAFRDVNADLRVLYDPFNFEDIIE